MIIIDRAVDKVFSNLPQNNAPILFCQIFMAKLLQTNLDGATGAIAGTVPYFALLLPQTNRIPYFWSNQASTLNGCGVGQCCRLGAIYLRVLSLNNLAVSLREAFYSMHKFTVQFVQVCLFEETWSHPLFHVSSCVYIYITKNNYMYTTKWLYIYTYSRALTWLLLCFLCFCTLF